MTPAQREAVVRALPSWIPWEECSPPEGDVHFDTKAEAREVLKAWFSRLGRPVYLAAELAVYYPGEPRFAPDLLAVVDVDTHPRNTWVVSAEGRGLDWVLEITATGNRRKDLVDRVVRYAELGIKEYFVYDHPRQRVLGWRLPSPGARRYDPIAPRAERLPSSVLGLDLLVTGQRLRFVQGNAELLLAQEIITRLEALVEERAAAAEEELRVREEAEQRAAEAEQRATEAEQRIEALEAELARLRARDPSTR